MVMTMIAFQYPWTFEVVGQSALDPVLSRGAGKARPLTDELLAFGLPAIWTNVDNGVGVAARVVRDVGTASLDVSVLVWVPSTAVFVDLSGAFLARGVALVTASRDRESLRVFALRIIAAVNESLGGGAPLAELTLRV